MPTITIYLTNELYDKIKNSPSKIVRAALEKYFNIELAQLKKCDDTTAQ
jgi:hypothetical protein